MSFTTGPRLKWTNLTIKVIKAQYGYRKSRFYANIISCGLHVIRHIKTSTLTCIRGEEGSTNYYTYSVGFAYKPLYPAYKTMSASNVKLFTIVYI